MARLDDLVAQIADQSLRREIESSLAVFKRRQRFGLVFEEHVPETSALLGLPIQPGSLVQRRDDPSTKSVYRVITVTPEGQATVEMAVEGKQETREQETMCVHDLLVVKRFGEPIYPTLTSLGAVRRGATDKPHHAVINGENFHALQLLAYLFEEQVDCIYIDPPYNTGARDWKYNNDYVDDNDSWHHSKWLSFMEKRLRVARRLLKTNGVLIITIDEHEVNHLGLLLERIFPEYLRYMVTIVINPKGTAKANFARVDEQAFFVVPDSGGDIVTGKPVSQVALPFADLKDDAEPENDSVAESNDDEGDEVDGENDEADAVAQQEALPADRQWEYQHARRRGSESSYRQQRPNQFYPIYIDEGNRSVVHVGPSIPRDEDPVFDRVEGLRPI